MADRIAPVCGCLTPKITRGMCPSHYYRWRRDTPPGQRGPAPRSTRQFWDFVDTSGDCWIWTGPTIKKGYGAWCGQGVKSLAHRYALGLLEPCPDPSLFACHHCDNPPCVNPNHLYWGTVQDNTRDRDERQGVPNKGNFKTHCNQGHALTGDNLRIVGKEKRRWCRTCDNERSRLRMAAKRKAARDGSR